MYIPSVMDFVISTAEGTLSSDIKEIPVCAAIVINSEIISMECNMVNQLASPLMHAEFIVISNAIQKLQTKYLDTASIYITLEPCSFCSAALEKIRIKNIFFGAYSYKTGSITHGCRTFDHSTHKPNIIGGIQERRCANIIMQFFQKIRKAGKK